ncbi:MAG: low molecular weight protein-tyrosine-phosphatase [Solirubrobacterales bacterium]
MLFVCLCNICRSPTAEGVMAHLLAEEGREDEFELDSAGTGGWHVGDPPDERAKAAAADRGIELGGASRKFRHSDFDRFDLIVAMDRSNLADMRAMAEGPEDEAKLSLLREHDPEAVAAEELDVPDPYYGGEQGFEDVLEVVDAGCRGLLSTLDAGDI